MRVLSKSSNLLQVVCSVGMFPVPTWLLLAVCAAGAGAIEPITSALIAGGSFLMGCGVLNFNYDSWKSAPLVGSLLSSGPALSVECMTRECCRYPYVNERDSLLRSSMAANVYGQHLIVKNLPDILHNYLNNEQPRKPLVISLHGTTGVGKNFVTKFVAKSIYQLGMKSRFVHLFVGSMDFPHQDKYHVDKYADNLREWVMGNLTACSRSLFIFDEVDKIPAGVLDAIKPFMDYYGQLNDVVLSKAVFVLLSNTGGRKINTVVAKQWAEGRQRESLTLRDFERAISEGAFSETGGLYRSNIISSALVDFYMPLMPLERDHVRLCVRDELQQRDSLKQAGHMINDILDMIRFDQQTTVFAKTGCKDVANKVNLVIDRMKYQ